MRRRDAEGMFRLFRDYYAGRRFAIGLLARFHSESCPFFGTTIAGMKYSTRLVTLGGECFDVHIGGDGLDERRGGTVHNFQLFDVREKHPDMLVLLFLSERFDLLTRGATRLDDVKLNVIRRAFDAGKLSFGTFAEDTVHRLDIQESDFQKQTVGDAEIREFMMHKAYWEGYKLATHPEQPIDFETPEDLDYLGATQIDIRRNISRLRNQGMLDRVLEGNGRPTEQLIAVYESKMGGEGRATLHDMPTKQPPTHQGLSIFISHSSKDAELALALIDLLKAGLALTSDQIRCSSVDGYRLPVGVNSEGKLREEVNAAKVVVGLITRSSLTSYYVMFELGARWGADLFLAPLLAGVKASELSGPLSLLNALSANNDAQLHQLLEDIANHLGLRVQPPASYIRNITAVKALADALGTSATPPVAATFVKQKLRLGVSVEGNPPSQLLRVTANQPVELSRVEYMLSSEATIEAEDVSKQGDKIEIPINDGSVLKLWNTPRADRNHYDHSGPAKIAVTVSTDGETSQYILPIQMQSGMQGNTMVRKLVGSKTFYGS
jgi:hypothetical protein